MMKLRLVLLIGIMISGFCLNLTGQFTVFTPYNPTPIHLNPAFNGIFDARYRLSLQYKDQGSRYLQKNAYRHYFFNGEMRFHGLGNDFWSAGLILDNSIAGSSNYQQSFVLLNTAYLKKLSGNKYRKTAQYLSFGMQSGFGQFKLSPDNFIFGDQYDPMTGELSTSTSESVLGSKIFPDLNAGLVWYYVAESRFSITAGSAIYHMNKPGISLIDNNSSKLAVRWSTVLNTSFNINDHFSIQPSFILHKQQSFHTLFTGSNFSFGNFENRDLSMGMGFWLRSNIYENIFYPGSLIFSSMLSLKKFQLGASVSFSINKLQELDDGLGSLEISAIYLLGDFGEKHRLLCPKL